MVHNIGQGINAICHEVLQSGADDIEGQVKHEQHDEDEAGNGGIFSRENPVNLLGTNPLLTLLRLDNGCLTDSLDEVKLHVGNGGGAVHAALLFHLYDDMLQHFLLIGIQIKLRKNQRIALDGLVGSKGERETGALCMVLDDGFDRMVRAVDGSAVIILGAEILNLRLLLVLCDVKCVADQLVDALVSGSGNRNDGDAEEGLHAVDINGAVVGLDLIHHVERNDHRNIHLQKLHGKIEVSLDVGGIDDVDDGAGLVIQNKIP